MKRNLYIADGYTGTPTLNKFHESNAFVRGIVGPFGSAKSTACAMEILHRSLIMPITYGTNERRTKWAIIRATYPELLGTVLETWKKILPLHCLQVKLSNREQPSITVDFTHEDGSRINIRMQLFALDNPKLVDKLGSYEYTGAWINECREIPREIFEALTGRVGRYPGPIFEHGDDGELIYDEKGDKMQIPYWHGIIMDTNPPNMGHWYYKLAEERRPKNYEFFQQPPALLKNRKTGEWIPNPEAENIDNLLGGYKYYYNQIGGKDEAWIRVYVQGRYGTLSQGLPVYPMYKDHVHYVDRGGKSFKIYPQLPILAGVDYGFNSAVVFCQFVNGQLRVIDEIFIKNITTRDFIQEYVKPYIANNFRGMEIEWFGDPAGDTRSSVAGGTGALEYLQQGIPMKPAATNLINPRIQSVATFLNRRDGFVMSNKCMLLRMGFMGEYCFERVLVATERYRDKPTKTHESCHVHDSLQYITLSLDPTYTNKRFSKVKIQDAPMRWGA